MKRAANSENKAFSGKTLRQVLVVGAVVLITAAALSIPFAYQSQTLWYKLGADKVLLLVGQLLGLLTAVLICAQVLLAARGGVLKNLFGVAALIRWHRRNGIVVAVLACCHMLLVLAPEGLTNLPIGMKFWPEMVGALLLVLILAMAISSHFREKLKLNYQRWRAVHRLVGYLAIPLVGIHMLFVCDSYENPVPRAGVLLVLLAVGIGVFLSKLPTQPKKT